MMEKLRMRCIDGVRTYGGADYSLNPSRQSLATLAAAPASPAAGCRSAHDPAAAPGFSGHTGAAAPDPNPHQAVESTAADAVNAAFQAPAAWPRTARIPGVSAGPVDSMPARAGAYGTKCGHRRGGAESAGGAAGRT